MSKKGVSMITSKSKAIETDCRSLLVYIKLLCDCTRITWTLAFEGIFKMQLQVRVEEVMFDS